MDVSELKKLRYEKIIRETEKAINVRFPDGVIEWLPKSQTRMIGSDLYASDWIIETKGIEDYVDE